MGPAGKSLRLVLAAGTLTVFAGTATAGASFRGPDISAPGNAAPPGSAFASKRSLSADALRHHLRAQIRSEAGVDGAYVADLDARRGGKLMAYHASHSLILASNAKLFSTAAYLERFGPRNRFATRLWTRGHREGFTHETLVGSLALVGGGDPALAEPSFAEEHNLPLTSLQPLAKAVRTAGIKRVEGNIKADPTIFDAQRMPHQTGITGINLGSLSGLEFNSGWLDGQPAPSPATLAGAELKHELADAGVKVTGSVKVGATPQSLHAKDPVGVVDSPTVGSIIAEVNTPSDATWAEMITKRLGTSTAKQGTTARGARRIERFTHRAGSHVSLENGSGLSRIDKATPRDVVNLLRHMDHVGDAGVYRRSLARPCATGTVDERMCGTAAAHGCHVKTGTLDDVSALSGYCDAHGHRIAFAILMNAVTDFDRAHAIQDRMAALVSRYAP